MIRILYHVQAKRKYPKAEWSGWTVCETREEALKHCEYVEKLGYCARIVERVERYGLDKIH